jgi:LAO/AO transport system kinase
MQDRFLDEGVFIRSMASRGHSGGLARTTARVVAVLDALGTDTVIVETVGVGQEEIEVVRVVDTVALVTVPGLGDDIQAIKAGVLEIADVLVVNKADRPGADETVRDLAQMLSLGPSVRPGRALPAPGGPPSEAWKPPIVRTVAATGDGTDELVRAVDRHRAWGRDSGECDRRRADAARVEVEALLRESLVRRLEERVGSAGVKRAVERVASREVDPYTAVEELLAKYR